MKRLVLAVLVLLVLGCQQQDTADIERADRLFLSGTPTQARQAYEDFVRAHPDSTALPRALLGLARVEHFRVGDYDRAVETYQRVVALFAGGKPAAEALENIVDIQLTQTHDYQSAIGWLGVLSRDYASLTGRGDYYLDRTAWAHFQLEEYGLARRDYQRLLDDYPRSELAAAALIGIADSYYVEDRIPDALAAYHQALTRVEDDKSKARINFRIANCLEESGRLREARRVYRELLDCHPNPAAVRIRLAGVEGRLKKGVK